MLTSDFIEKIGFTEATECWLWLGTKNDQGYGMFKHQRTHRLAYEMWNGPLIKGLEIDHLCRTHDCINPDHLEQVTHQVNCQRGQQGQYEAIRTYCPQGHPYDEENTYIRRTGRGCRACLRVQKLESYHRRKNDR